MQPEKTNELLQQLTLLINRYQNAIRKDEPFQQVYLLMKEIKKKKKELQEMLAAQNAGAEDHTIR